MCRLLFCLAYRRFTWLLDNLHIFFQGSFMYLCTFWFPFQMFILPSHCNWLFKVTLHFSSTLWHLFVCVWLKHLLMSEITQGMLYLFPFPLYRSWCLPHQYNVLFFTSYFYHVPYVWWIWWFNALPWSQRDQVTGVQPMEPLCLVQ